MSNTLLPPKSTELERAIATVLDRTIEPLLSDLWNAQTCPVDLLPWLAHAMGVTSWSESWPEQQRRDAVATALDIARQRGTVGAVRLAMQVVGFGGAGLVEGNGSLSAAQQAACTPLTNCWAYFGITMPESEIPPTPQSLRTLIQMINQAKPERSILSAVWQPLPAEVESIEVAESISIENALEVLSDSLERNRYDGTHLHDGTITYGQPAITEELTEIARTTFLSHWSAAFALSMRQLAFSATRCIRVRRTVDNAEQDIGFTLLGALDTATLLAFCGAGSGYVSVWYNQATNGASGNAIQSTAANQYRIVNAGVLDTHSTTGLPMLKSPDVLRFFFIDNLALFRNKSANRVYATFHQSNTGSWTRNKALFCALQSSAASIRARILTGDSLSAQHILYNTQIHPDGGAYAYQVMGSAAQWTGTESTLIDCHYLWSTGIRNNIVINEGVTTSSGATGLSAVNTSNTDSANLTIGGYYNGSAAGNLAPFSLQEFIIFDSSAHDANAADIRADIATYYGITL